MFKLQTLSFLRCFNVNLPPGGTVVAHICAGELCEVRAPEEVVSGVIKSAFFCGLGQHTHTHTHTAFREAVIASPALFPDSRDERVGAGWLLGHWPLSTNGRPRQGRFHAPPPRRQPSEQHCHVPTVCSPPPSGSVFHVWFWTHYFKSLTCLMLAKHTVVTDAVTYCYYVTAQTNLMEVCSLAKEHSVYLIMTKILTTQSQTFSLSPALSTQRFISFCFISSAWSCF